MKVVFLENVIDFGGARKSTIELAKNISNNHDAYIIDVHGTCQPFIDACISHGINLEILLKQDNQIIMSNYRNVCSRLLSYLRFFFVTLKARKKLKLILKRIKADFIVVNNTKVLPLLFRNNFGAEVVLFARGWFLPEQINSRDRVLYKHFVDRYFCVSEATRYALISSGLATLSNTFVVHNSIDIQHLDNVKPAAISVSEAEKIILISGGFLPSKGLHVAVEIAKRLKEMQFHFKMIITGIVYDSFASKEYYDRILKMIDAYSLHSTIQMEVGNSSVLQYFKAADIFIHPSDTEGLPRVVMEAMACRVPVVANAVGGVVDYILDGFTGVITRYNCVDDYVNAILKISTDKSFKARIVENAFQLVLTCFDSTQQLRAFERNLSK